MSRLEEEEILWAPCAPGGGSSRRRASLARLETKSRRKRQAARRGDVREHFEVGTLAGERPRRRIDASKALLARFFRTLGRGGPGAPGDHRDS